MKKNILFTFIMLLILSSNSFAQINVGSIELVQKDPGKFKDSDLQELESSTTIFIYRVQDEAFLDELKRAVNESWKFSKIAFVSIKDFNSKKYNEDYSFLRLSGYVKVKTTDKGTYETTKMYLKLYKYVNDKEVVYSRIEIYPEYYSAVMAIKKSHKGMAEYSKYIYTEAVLRNYHPGFIKNYLQLVNDRLTNAKNQWHYESTFTLKSLKQLKKDTLYIPEYALLGFNQLTGSEKRIKDESKLLKNYPYPYKIVSPEFLSELIMNSDKPIYYLDFIRSASDKFICIYNSMTGERVYNNYTPMSGVVKSKDLGKIVKAMK